MQKSKKKIKKSKTISLLSFNECSVNIAFIDRTNI